MLNIPLFYNAQITAAASIIVLDESTSRHCVQVLRMKAGEQLYLTDGKGALLTTEIFEEHKTSTKVKVLSRAASRPRTRQVTIAISLVKNTNRFEWFLEKATEVGVSRFIPLICDRTEKQHFRLERMQGIIVSAMLQSRQTWLPEMSEPCKYAECVSRDYTSLKLIAHCQEDNKISLPDVSTRQGDVIIFIGPEGDFTPTEIQLATANGFTPVSLGSTRLRTETAGLVAASRLVPW